MIGPSAVSRDDVSTIAWTFAALAATGNTVDAFADIDGWVWAGAQIHGVRAFTIALLVWVFMTVRARRSARLG